MYAFRHGTDFLSVFFQLFISGICSSHACFVLVGRINQYRAVRSKRCQVGRFIIGADQKLLLHIVQAHIHAGNPEEFALRIVYRGNNAYHHDIFSHQLINIRVHDIWLSGFFYLHIVFFFVIVKRILVFFKNISRLIFIRIYDRFISNIPLMHAVRLPIGIGNRILLKISKCRRIPAAAFQKPHQRRIYGVPLFFWVQLGNIAQRACKSHNLAICIFDIVRNQKRIFISCR